LNFLIPSATYGSPKAFDVESKLKKPPSCGRGRDTSREGIRRQRTYPWILEFVGHTCNGLGVILPVTIPEYVLSGRPKAVLGKKYLSAQAVAFSHRHLHRRRAR
jgi:hypothetical protein